MKKLLLITLTAVMALFAFSACATEQSTQPEPERPGIENKGGNNAMDDEIYFTVNDAVIAVALESNIAVNALKELLNEGDITYTASDYGGFEKVGNLGRALPHSDTQMTTEAGDVVLYSGNQIVIFYGSNSWSYTKLGRIQGYSAIELKNILTEKNPVTIKISAER